MAVFERIRACDHHYPVARSGHRIVVTESDLFSLGGYNPEYWHKANVPGLTNYPLFRELWQFNFACRKWRKLDIYEGMPLALASHSATINGHLLITFGGTSIPFGETSSNDVNIFDLDRLQWRHLDTSGTKPIPSYGVGMCLIKNKLFVCGGTTGYEYNLNVHSLDLSTCQWEKLKPSNTNRDPLPPERYRHEIATDGEKIFVFGGGTSYSVFPFDKIPIFDTETQFWAEKATTQDPVHGFPAARRCHGCTQLRNDVYMCGGYNGGNIFGDLWKINLETLHWVKFNVTMPEPAYFLDISITRSGCLYVFGGVTKLDVKRTFSLYSIQLKCLSLREICWQKLTHLISHIDNLSASSLVPLGIPRDLVQRIQFADAIPKSG